MSTFFSIIFRLLMLPFLFVWMVFVGIWFVFVFLWMMLMIPFALLFGKVTVNGKRLK